MNPMKVLSKFDSEEIGEVDDIKFSELKLEKKNDSKLNLFKFSNELYSIVEKLSMDDESLRILSLETGRTINSCRDEIKKTVFAIRYNFSNQFLHTIGLESIRLESLNEFTGVIPDRSMPVYTMVRGIMDSMNSGKLPIILHNPMCPLTTMTLSNLLFEKIKETGEFILDTVEDNPVDAFDKNLEGQRIQAWGTSEEVKMIQKNTSNNMVLWKKMENGLSIVSDRSHLEMAANTLRGNSYETISNKELRSQVFLVADREYIFFKNRVVEYLKRDIKKGYGPEGDVNYFNSPEEAERARESVRKLLGSGFDYIDTLHESIHVLENQYDDTIVPIDQIRGPVIIISHFKSIKNAMDRTEKFNGNEFVNVFTDSYSAMDYIQNRTGLKTKIYRNVERSWDFLP